jgi:transcriptional regulator with XRE-family HTH domain
MAYLDADRKELGARLKGARINVGMTLQEVADTLRNEGFPVQRKQNVGHWETGAALPDIFILRRLAKLYKQPLDALVWDNALSMEAMQFAAEFQALDAEKKRTLRAIWMAYIQAGNAADSLPAAPAPHKTTGG